MKYTNLDGKETRAKLSQVLKWQLGLHDEKRPPAPATGVPVPVVANDGSALRAATRDALTWIGHASFLVQLDGASALVDPVLSDALGGIVKRNVAPGLSWSALPSIDLVLITHNHRDHLDLPTLKRLGPTPTYVVPRGVGATLTGAGLPHVVELGWWERHRIAGMEITLVPAQHWSRRGLLDLNTSWWGGYVLEGNGKRLYHAGDTAWFDGFAAIGARCGPLHAAMLPIGAYAPRWFMRHQHMNPEDAMRAFRALGAERFVAMHWGTFKLSDEDLREPPHLLRAIWRAARLPASALSIPAIGETLWLDAVAG